MGIGKRPPCEDRAARACDADWFQRWYGRGLGGRLEGLDNCAFDVAVFRGRAIGFMSDEARKKEIDAGDKELLNIL
jgi:hypothetical protein